MASFARRFFSRVRSSDTPVSPRKMNLNSPDVPAVFLPPVNRSMQTLDRSFFRKVVPLAAASVSDVRQIGNTRAQLTASGELFRLAPLKPLRDDDQNPGAKCLLLKHDVDPNGIAFTLWSRLRLADSPIEPSTWSPTLSKLVQDDIARIRPYDLTLTYNDWTMRESSSPSASKLLTDLFPQTISSKQFCPKSLTRKAASREDLPRSATSVCL
jgi:hypothetical protein